MVTRWYRHLVPSAAPLRTVLSLFPSPAPFFLSLLLLRLFPSRLALEAFRVWIARPSVSAETPMPGRVALFTREHSILLSLKPLLFHRSPSLPFLCPVPSSRLRRGIARLLLLDSWYASALSLSRPLSFSLARHNYYLPDTHHRLIPQVFHGHNKYRLMTESVRLLCLVPCTEGIPYLHWSVVHHVYRSQRKMLSLARVSAA